MTLSPESHNVSEVSFVAMALQTQQEINAAYMRKMNRDYAAHIPNPETTSIKQIKLNYITYPMPEWYDYSTSTPTNENPIEQESS
jgi:hypothetical protein